ncbi:hypothetical protein ACFQ0G_10150 [Streptomyces chiangmaiensis]
MVAEVLGDYRNESVAWKAVAQKLGIGSTETLRWGQGTSRAGRRGEGPAGSARLGRRPEATMEESAQIS